jgi:hypothetical protein
MSLPRRTGQGDFDSARQLSCDHATRCASHITGRCMQWHSTGCRPLFSSFNVLSFAAGVQGDASAAQAPAPLPVASPPPGMSVSRIPTGFIASRASRAFVGGRSDEVRRFALCGLLVRHPRGDLLFDTGIGSQWAAHRLALPWLMRQVTEVLPGVPAARQLAEHGYALSQLAGIVLTHAHWDHISGAQDFPGTPVWLNDAERAFVASGHRSTRVARAGLGDRVHRFAVRPASGFDRRHRLADGRRRAGGGKTLVESLGCRPRTRGRAPLDPRSGGVACGVSGHALAAIARRAGDVGDTGMA